MASKRHPQRTQRISFLLSESSLISPLEGRLLQILNSRPLYYKDKLGEIATKMQRSIRTVQRVIDSLVKKGLVLRRYSKFKRLILQLVSLPMQDEFAKGNVLLMLVNKAFQMRKYKKKDPRRGGYMTPMSQSTKGSILNQKEGIGLEQKKALLIAQYKLHNGLI